MIRARGLHKQYRDEQLSLTVLDGADLEVRPGEFVAIVGPSGSGKSTLLNVLGGLDVDYQGEVMVDGIALNGLDDRARASFRNQHVGFVFQSFHLVPHLTALDNVLLPSFFATSELSAGEARARAQAALTRVGLGEKQDRVPARLSGGERQRVAIARAIFGKPKVLFCDEPTGNLDASTGAEVISLFKALNAEGLTVLAVTHEDRMSQAAQRVLRLKDGKLVPEGAA